MSKINYLMLMMVDPHVHFHVLPRYEGDRSHGGIEVVDAGWPGPARRWARRWRSSDEQIARRCVGLAETGYWRA
jgi:diadenosine tetraphosphate (Ap4A) HIT family hydrolase